METKIENTLNYKIRDIIFELNPDEDLLLISLLNQKMNLLQVVNYPVYFSKHDIGTTKRGIFNTIKWVIEKNDSKYKKVKSFYDSIWCEECRWDNNPESAICGSCDHRRSMLYDYISNYEEQIDNKCKLLFDQLIDDDYLKTKMLINKLKRKLKHLKS